MKNPFSALKSALQSVFLVVPMRNGVYNFPEIQRLKQALEDFKPEHKRAFIELLNAIRGVLPYIAKKRINFNTIKEPVDVLAQELTLPIIDWDKFLAHPNAPPKFQFSALNHKPQEIALLPWLAAKSGVTVTQHTLNTQVQLLLEYCDLLGFSQKLSAHLAKEPEFLFRLIIESESNFIKIAQTRLILYLTDQEIAKTIIRHLPNLIQGHPNPSIQAAQLVDKINEILSNGRSVSTLLRNTEAKFILDSSELFQIYQIDKLNGQKDRPTPHPAARAEVRAKPRVAGY